MTDVDGTFQKVWKNSRKAERRNQERERRARKEKKGKNSEAESRGAGGNGETQKRRGGAKDKGNHRRRGWKDTEGAWKGIEPMRVNWYQLPKDIYINFKRK